MGSESEEPVVQQLEALEAELEHQPVRAGEEDRLRHFANQALLLALEAERAGIQGLDHRLRQLRLRASALALGQELGGGGATFGNQRSRSPVGTNPVVAPQTQEQVILGGVVREASTGEPLSDITVELWNGSGFYVRNKVTDARGGYAFTELDPGTYYVATYLAPGFLDEVYDDVTCIEGVNNGCYLSAGTPILATGDRLDLNFDLTKASAIVGRMVSADTGQPLERASVVLWDPAGIGLLRAYADSTGHYEIQNLEAGSYFMTTFVYGSHLEELYDDIPCPGGGFYGCSPENGTPVVVPSEDTLSGIDFALERLGAIEGLVTDGLSGEPIPVVWVSVYGQDLLYENSAYTDASGRFLVGGLEAGTYTVLAISRSGFAPKVYNNIECTGGSINRCDISTGTPVVVGADSTISGIDFFLENGCLATAHALCLGDRRFRVEARWETPDGGQGPAVGARLSSDTGSFWFFDSTNLELFVKVLDACSSNPFNSFWVFSSGLTNLGVTLSVTDTQTRQVREYSNPVGQPYQTVQDTAAFSTCP